MSGVLSSVMEVFTLVIEWFVSAVSKVTPIFWSAEGGLTFLGVLAVAGLAISVMLLVVNIVKDFLRFR